MYWRLLTSPTKKLLVLLTGVLLIYSCSHVISKDSRDLVDETVSAEALFANPDVYKGKTVILGGFIVKTTNVRNGSYVEVVQNPLDFRGRPRTKDRSYGRFLVLADGFIDTAIFSPGRALSVAGEVLGTTTQALGEMRYPYLLIKSREMHIISQTPGMPVHIGIGVWQTF